MNFYLVKGSTHRALAMANRINTGSVYRVSNLNGQTNFKRLLPEDGVKF
ncbi:MAG: hypothetical protein ACE5D0_02020 [Fidelibacterota bacterium]